MQTAQVPPLKRALRVGRAIAIINKGRRGHGMSTLGPTCGMQADIVLDSPSGEFYASPTEY
jgi:hypothetical protein